MVVHMVVIVVRREKAAISATMNRFLLQLFATATPADHPSSPSSSPIQLAKAYDRLGSARRSASPMSLPNSPPHHEAARTSYPSHGQ